MTHNPFRLLLLIVSVVFPGLVLAQNPTSVNLVSDNNPALTGTGVNLTATVVPLSGTGNPVGLVTFFDGSNSLSSLPVLGGQAQLNVPNPSVGSHVITAQYLGYGSFAGSTSAPLTEVVTLNASTVTLTATTSNTAYATANTLTAAVSVQGGQILAAGLIDFLFGGVVVARAPILGGMATLDLSLLPIGSYNIVAQYAGYGIVAGSSSAPWTQTVVPVPTNTVVTSSAANAVPRAPVTFTATVLSGAGTRQVSGWVTFLDGTTVLGHGQLSNGSTSLTTTGLAIGQHSITVQYPQQFEFGPSVSPTFLENITSFPTNTSVTSSLNPAPWGSRVFFNVTVTPGVGGSHATGTVQFLDGNTVLNSAPVVANSATYHTSILTVGTHTITISYLGDANHSPSISQPLSEVITAYPTTTTLVSSNPTSYLGSGVTLSATVSRVGATGNPSGLVTFFDGTTSLGFAPVLGGVANFPIYTLASGPHTITAQYGAYGPDAGSVSMPILETIAQPLSATPATANQGTQVTLTFVGTLTHFARGATYLSAGTDMVAISGVNVSDPTDATAVVNVSPTAILGPRTISLITGSEVASAAFTVSPGTPGIVSVSPATGFQGDTNDMVNITGAFTHFAQGITTANFGPNVTVNSLTINSSASATASLSISPTAPLGPQNVTMTTGSEVAVLTGGYTVLSSIPTVQSVTPNTAQQGQNVTVAIQGQNTNFLPNQTTVSFGSDINLGFVTVNGPTSLSVPLFIPVTALTGLHTVTVTTGSQVVTGIFNVNSGVASIAAISPNSGAPNTPSLSVTITGNFTHFGLGTATTATFGPGISVNSSALGGTGTIATSSPTQATATLTIDPAALVGPRDVTVTTGTEVVTVLGGFTVQANTGVGPTVSLISPAYGASGIPINPQISVQFSQPVNPASVTSADLILNDTFTGQPVSVTIALDATGRVATLLPNQNLAINRQYNVQATNGIQNNFGNTLTNFNSYFTTGASSDLAGPTLLGTNPDNGDTNVPLNFGNVPSGTGPVLVLGFDKPLNPLSLPAGISLTTGGTSVAGTFALSSNGAQVTFHPANLLVAGATYVLSFSAITDLAGNSLTNPGSVTFTAGTASDTTQPTVISENPVRGEIGVGLNVTPTIRFSKPVDELTINSASLTLYDSNTGQYVPAAVSIDPARLNATLTPANPLNPGDQYNIFLSSYFDIPGNAGIGFSTSFTTGLSTDTTPLTVASVSPSNSTTGVPENAPVIVVMNKPVNQLTTGTNAIQLASAAGGSVPGNITLASDQVTFTFTPTAALAPSTTYTVTVSGFSDVDGNAVAPFASSFTTATASVATSPTVLTISPSSASNVAVTTPVVVTFSAPIDPATVSVNSVAVELGSGGPRMAGTYAVSGATVIFTPTSPYPPSSTIYVYVDLYASVQDLAGNLGGFTSTSFGTASTPDTVPPVVVSVSPPNGSQNLGVSTPVVITFSKSINPSTISFHTIVLFNGNTPIGSGIQISPDNRTVTLTQTLPHSATITLATTGIQDLSGNSVPDFTSEFTTAPQPTLSSPQVLTQRPGNGATGVPPTSVISLFTSASLNPATVPGALQVSENGNLVSGTINITGNGQAIEFSPAQPFSYGATVQVFLNSSAQDVNGIALSSYSGQFTIAGNSSTTAPSVITTSPFNGASNVATNAFVDVGFNEALNPATVTISDIFLYDNTHGTTVPTSISLLPSGTVVRLVPAASLTGGDGFYVRVTSGVQDINGVAAPYSPAGSFIAFFTAGTSPDTTAPTVVALAPSNLSTNIGVNSVVRAVFSKPVDPTSVTSQTFAISYAGTSNALSTFNFDPTFTVVTAAPVVPLPSSTQVTIGINGIQDFEGNTVAPVTSNFTTAAAGNFSQPQIVKTNFYNGEANVPVNTVFTIQFDRPMDTSTFNSGDLYLYRNRDGFQIPAAMSFSPDSTTVTLTPTAPLSVGDSFTLYSNSALDLTGIQQFGRSYSFTTSFVSTSASPQVVATNPLNNDTGIATNVSVVVQFNEAVQPPQPGNVTLSGLGSVVPTTATLSSSSNNQLLTIVPASPLNPNTVYTLAITGITDVAGNQLVGTVTSTFTTGPGVDVTSAQVVAHSPASGEIGVGLNVLPTVRFSKPVDPLTITSSTFTFYDYGTGQYMPTVVSVSADRMTAQLMPQALLSPGTQYGFFLSGYTDVTGNSGNFFSSTFITGAAVDSTPLSVQTVSPASLSGTVPVNATVQLTLSKPVNVLSVGPNAVTLTASGGAAVSGVVSISSNLTTLTFAPAILLNPSTTYNVQASGFTDIDGNPAVAFNSSFTTSATATPVTVGPSVASFSPVNGSSSIPANSPIVVTFSTAVNPATINVNSVAVDLGTFGGTRLAGSYAVSGATVTFTPLAPYPANATIFVLVDYYAGVQDFAGNNGAFAQSSFTTANTPSTAAPAVLAISPPNGAQNVGINTPVVLTFSESLNPSTVNSDSVTLFNGDTNLGVSPQLSTDNRTVVLNTSLPAGATITVAVTGAVQDLNGNALPNFLSQFTVSTNPPNNSPGIIGQRPASGATAVPIGSVITLFANRPLNSLTIPGALHISQNGMLISGSVNITGNGEGIEFTPLVSLSYGALVEIFLDPSAQDIYGNSLNAYSGQFTIAGNPSTTAPSVTTTSPFNGASNVATNVFVDIGFNEALNPATVTSSNIFLYDNTHSTIVPAAISLLPSGTGVRLVPTTLLTGGDGFYVRVTSGVQDINGIAAPYSPAGSFIAFFTAGTVADFSPLTVTALAPANLSTNIGINATIIATFNKQVDTLTVNGSTIQLTYGSSGTDLPSSILFNSTDNQVTISPMAPLPASTPVTVTIAGVTDIAGNTVAPTTAIFTTAATANFTNPNVIATNFSAGQTNVPVNTAVTFQFDRPMDLGTFNANNTFLYDYHTNQNVTTVISFSPDATMVTLTPASQLAVDTQYGAFSNSALDLTGNVQNGFSSSFTTSSAVATAAPQVLSTNPPNGSTGVPINVRPIIQFNEPIQPDALGQIALSQSGGPAVSAAVSLSNGNQTVTVIPGTPLQPNTSYTLSIAGVVDVAGNPLTTVTVVFSTSATVDVVAPSIIGTNPAQNETVGINVVSTFQFSKPVDPLTISSANVQLYNYYAGVRIPATVTVAPNGLSMTVQPVNPLAPGTRYEVQVNSGYTDIAGNSGNGITLLFYTGLSAVASPLSVSAVTPPNGSAGVQVNTLIQVVMSNQVDDLTITNMSVQLRQGFLLVPGTVSLGNGTTLTFTPSGLLNPSASYTISLSGLLDVDGNALAPFTSSFTTGTSAVADATAPTVVSITPANGTTGVAVSTPISVVFSKPINPLSVTDTTIRIADSGFFGTILAGTYAVSGATVTFTPLSPYPANTQIFVDVDYFGSVADLAGNTGVYPGQKSFTTANTPDTTAPTVLNVTPANGTQNLGVTTPVVLTFSKSTNPTTVSSSTVTLFNGTTKLSPSISVSADNTTVVLNTLLPAGATITVAATSGVQDLSGNALVSFSSVFTTSPNPPTTPGSVIGQRPANGATSVAPNSVITLFLNHPIDPSTVDAAFQVSQNGTLISGTINVTGNGQAVDFIPSVPLAYGENIQVFLQSGAQDIFGNAFNVYNGQFNTIGDPASTVPTIMATSPTYGQSGIPLNAVVDFGFNEALNSSTVTSTNLLLYDAANTSVPIASTASLPFPTVARLVPSSGLTSGHTYYMYATSGIQDVNGVAATYNSTGSFIALFVAGSASDTTPLTVTAFAPPNAATGVGINAAVRTTFNKPIDPLSLNSTTFTAQYGSGQFDLPSSIAFSSNNTQVSVTPMAPLPPSTPITLTVNGVNDLAGNLVTPATVTFTTAPGIDTSNPVLVATSFSYGEVGIPVNAVFTLKFNKPMDTSTFTSSTLYLYDPMASASVATTFSFSPDSTAATLLPTSTLATNHTYYLYSNGAQDLAGNVQNSYSYIFTTGSAADTTPPAVVTVNPANGLTGAPLNTAIQILFSKPVEPASFGQITLTTGGVPVPFTPVLSNANTLLTLAPQNTLAPSTTYSFTVSGVEDVAGNQQSGSVTTQFSTATSVLLSGPTFLSATPASGSVSVPASTSASVTFSAPMDPTTFDPNTTFYLAINGPNTVVPATLSFSANYRTATLTPNASLQSATQYVITVTPALTDVSGNPINLGGTAGLTVLFTTQ